MNVIENFTLSSVFCVQIKERQTPDLESHRPYTCTLTQLYRLHAISSAGAVAGVAEEKKT